MTSLHVELDRSFAEAWKPRPGDKIVGIVMDLSVRDGTYGPYPIVTMRSDDGEFAVHCFHEVLQNELARVAPKVGDHLGIKYAGKDEERGYHKYRVRRGGDGSAFDWARFGDPDAASDVSTADDVPADTSDLPGGSRESDDIPF